MTRKGYARLDELPVPPRDPASRPSSRASALARFFAYQATWWTCVLGAGSSWAGVGVAGTAAFAAAHLVTTTARRRELRLIVGATLLGVVVDSALVLAGAMAFPLEVALGPLPTPLWMVALWTGFGATLSSTFAGVLASRWRAAAFGAVAGPLAYAGGTRLGPLVVEEPLTASYGLIALGWAAAMVALAWLHGLDDAAEASLGGAKAG